jgi:predicted metal-dependent enzyme (double-stranded beta helix superfamily)
MSEKNNLPRLKAFVESFTSLIESQPEEPEILQRGGNLLKELVTTDDWLPEQFAQPHAKFYQQYLLYADPQSRFSVVSFVWGPGQVTPIHNHTVWGLVGVLKGGEFSQSYEKQNGGLVKYGSPVKLEPGVVEAVSPTIGDLHQVSNAFNDRVSISIHVYGADIGKVNRFVFSEDGTEKPFVSGYINTIAAELN